MFTVLVSLALLGAAPGTPPDWSKPIVKSILAREEGIRGLPTDARDTELLKLIGEAYQLTPAGGESLDGYARRVLKTREPTYPTVKEGQWLLALAGRFWADVAERCDVMARFEIDRKDRGFLEQKGKEAKETAAAIAGMVQTKVEGAGGFMAPLPDAKAEPATKEGCEAFVRENRVTVKILDRATFPDDQPPQNIERTPGGSIREFVAAMKQFNLEAQTLGMVNAEMRRGRGQLRLWIPAASPAIYLNELMRAAKEAAMSTAYLMVHRPDGELGQLVFTFGVAKPKKVKGKKPPEVVPVHCKDRDPMQLCVDRIVEEAKGAPLTYKLD